MSVGAGAPTRTSPPSPGRRRRVQDSVMTSLQPPCAPALPQLEGRGLAELDDDLLRRFYVDVLQPTFPPEELVSYDALRHGLRRCGSGGVVLLDGSSPVAGVVTEDYLDGRVRLVCYLAVVAAARSSGLGPRLLEAALADGEPGQVVLAEVEDPRYHPVTATNDPVARLRFYHRIGARLVPLRYVQPALRAGLPRVEHLLLVAVGTPPADVPGALVADFLTEYYGVCEGEEVCRSDVSFLGLREEASDARDGRLPLLDLGPVLASPPARPRP